MKTRGVLAGSVLGILFAMTEARANPMGAGESEVTRAPSDIVPPASIGLEPRVIIPECKGFLDVVVTIDAQGRAVDVVAPQGLAPESATVVVDVISGMMFEPGRRGEQPVAMKVTYRLTCAEADEDAATRTESLSEAELDELPGAELPTLVAAAPGEGLGVEFYDEAPEIEVLVTGESEAERLRRSPNAISVVELTSARQRTGTLGEVLSRQEGASVRTMGGLGGYTRFSLNGLANEQVRFFIDGVPLRFAGYSLGIANVPVDQLRHVEIHHGVVPARFGADALGGAVNLSTLATEDGTTANVSFMAGSFETARLAASASYRDSANHYVVRANAFRDRAENDFWLKEVPVVNSQGRVSRVSRPHFHNAYAADGLGIDLGLIDLPWANHLIVRGFYTEYDKEVPHEFTGVSDKNPWGEVTYGRSSSGILAMHQVTSRHFRLDTKVGYTNERLRFRDVSDCSYDWYGRCAVVRRSRGEISAVPTDAKVSDTFLFARVDGSWLITPQHEIRLALAPTSSSRQGENEIVMDSVPDPLEAKRRFVTSVAGVEYEVRDEDDVWTNNLFGKVYVRHLDARETLSNGNRRDWNQTKEYGGFGNAFRVNLSEAVFAKASYEYALRFPSIEELFGDGGQVIDNLELSSERSHNVNLELHAQTNLREGGEASASLRGFGRFLTDRIWLRAAAGYSVYDNIDSSRVIGAEGTLRWTVPGRWLNLSANGTWFNSRDTSGETPVPLPSDPWFFLNGQATFTQTQLVTKADSANLDWNVSYVHGFPLSTGERGREDTRLRVAAQTVHTAALRYVVEGDTNTMSASVEVNNVTNAEVMDFFGVQRPGRAFFLKLTYQARSAQ